MKRIVVALVAFLVIAAPVAAGTIVPDAAANCYDAGVNRDGTPDLSIVAFNGENPGCDGIGVEYRVDVLSTTGTLLSGPWLSWEVVP